MEEINRTERFKEVAHNLRTFVVKDPTIDAYSGVHQISFRLPNPESDTPHIFKYANITEFIEDLHALDISSPLERTKEYANKILNGLAINKSNPFTLEMY